MANGKLVLDPSVALVEVHFSFSNPSLVPISVRKWQEMKKETEGQLNRRRHEYVPGVLAIEPTQRCSAKGFLEALEAADFQMVDAGYQPRISPNTPNQTYHMVRFIFGRKLEGFQTMFAAVRPQIRKDLQGMLMTAMWRVRAFLNPFFKNGEQVPELHAANLNFEVRVPYGTREPGGKSEIRPVAELTITDNAVGLGTIN